MPNPPSNLFNTTPQQQPEGGPLNEAFSNIRMQNLFRPPDPIQGGPQTFGSAVQGFELPQPPAADLRPPRVFNMQEFYQPEHQASDMMYALLNQIPQRNQPGLGRKILSSLGGAAGGPQLADMIAYGPYNQQMQDWQTKFGPVEKAAGEERMGNVNLRALAYNIAQDQNMQERLRIQDADQKRKEKATAAYAAWKKWQMEKPNREIVEQKGGNYLLLDKDTGAGIDTGWGTGTLPPEYEIQIRADAAARVRATPTTIHTTGESTTTTQGPSQLTPQEEYRNQYNLAREMWNKSINEKGEYDPSIRDRIKLDIPNPGTFRVLPPPNKINIPPYFGPSIGGGSDAQWDTYKWLYEQIYKQPPPDLSKTTTTKTDRSSTSFKAPNSKNMPPTEGKAPATTPKLEANISVLRGKARDEEMARSMDAASRTAFQKQNDAIMAEAGLRQRAIDELTTQKKVVNEQTIKMVMDMLRKQK